MTARTEASGAAAARLAFHQLHASPNLGAAALVASTLTPLAATGGGYAPTSWGWSTLALLWVTAIALVIGRLPRPGALDWLLLTSLSALLGWIALSARWSTRPEQSVLEAERMLLYLAGAAVVVLLLRKRCLGGALVGVLIAVTLVSAYGLALRLTPDWMDNRSATGGERLSEPLGYWNAFGIFAAMGIVVALVLAVRARPAVGRALAAGSVVLLAPTLYLTFSRGGWLALAIGLAVVIAVDPSRRELLARATVVAPAPALAVWLAANSEALTTVGATHQEVTRAGHRLGVAILLLAAGAAAAVLAGDRIAHRLLLPRRLGVILLSAGLVAAAAVAVASLSRYGDPLTLATKARRAFAAEPAPVDGSLNRRLLSLSGDGRMLLWREAWAESRAHPWLGSGAGTFQQYWLQHRPHNLWVRDAHSLYLETLAELGPVGVLLLAAALGVPLVAGVRARRHPLVPAAFGAYAAYLFHAGADWDWEVTGVTLIAVMCGASLVVVARRPQARPRRHGRLPTRAAALVATLALTGFTLVGLAGNRALSAATAAARGHEWDVVEREASRAERWAPWSSEPWLLLGEVQLRRGDRAAALASFRRAISKDPRNWRAWFDLARSSSESERLRALSRAAALNPRSREIFDYRAALELRG